MRAGRLSLAIIIACVIAIPAVPPLREMARMVVANAKAQETLPSEMLPSRQELARVARRHPDDLFVQLAAAQEPSFFSGRLASNDRARLREIVSRYSESPAAHFRLGKRLLESSVVALDREEEYEGAPVGQPRSSPQSRTPGEEEMLEEAIKELRIASRLDRKNSAPDFLLAYAFFAKREDAEAEKALRTALGKPGWSLYTRELRGALLTLCEESGVPAVFAPIHAQSLAEESSLYARLLSLAQLLEGLGEKNRQAARHGKAILYYQSGVHLGEVMLYGSDSIIEGLTGSVILSITAYRFISEKEEDQISRLHLPRKGRIARTKEITGRNFGSYLSAQGASYAANAYARGVAQAENFDADSRNYVKRGMGQVLQAFASPQVLRAATAWLQTGYLLTLLILAGLVSLALRWWREEKPAPTWQWREWGALTVIGFGPGLAVNLSICSSEPGETSNLGTFVFAIVAAAVALLLPLVVPAVGGLLKRRRQPPDARLGKFRACLASFRTLLPPTFALLLAVAVILTIPAQLRLQQWAQEEKKIIQQGEVQYWKIGTSGR